MDINSIILFVEHIKITPEWLSAISTVILVLATIIYVFFTYKLTKETTKLREVETTPFISIYFDTTFPAVNRSKIIIKNIGKAPAYNISFDINEKYIELFNGYTFTNTISYFAPNQEFHILVDGFNIMSEKGYENISITVNYQSQDNRKISDLFNLEWGYIACYEKDNIADIGQALEDIKKEINTVNKTIKDKEYYITTKLKILKLEKTDMYLKFVFSNGYLGKICNDEISKLGISKIEEIYIDNGNLLDYSFDMKFTAEEIYYKLISLDKKCVKYEN